MGLLARGPSISRHVRSAAVAAAILAVLLFVYGQYNSGDSGSSSPVMREEPRALLVDADSFGAIVLRGDTVFGIRRDEGIVWEKDSSQIEDFTSLSCADRCPDLIASGLGQPGVPDPAPLIEGTASMPADWARASDGANTVLATGAGGALRLVSDAAGEATYELAKDGSIDTVPSAASRLIVFPRSADRRGVRVRGSAVDGTATTYVFYQTRDGWRLLGEASGSDRLGCTAPGGAAWIVGTPTITYQGEEEVALRSSVDGGSCWLTAESVLVSQNLSTPTGAKTNVSLLDARSGEERVAFEVEDEVMITASATTDTFALVKSGEAAVEIRSGSGKILDTIADVSAAQFVEDGTLCVIDRQGTPQWIPAHSP